MLLGEFVNHIRAVHNNASQDKDKRVVVVGELELSTAQLLVSPDSVQSFYDCLCGCTDDEPTSCKFGTVLWHLEWSYWCSFDVFLPLAESVAAALQGTCRRRRRRDQHHHSGGVKRLILYNVEDAFPVHNETLYRIMKDLAQIPTLESLEMHGVAFGPTSIALDGLCDGMVLAVVAQQRVKNNVLQKVVWSPFAANPTQGVTQIATGIIQSHFSGAFVMETRMDPTTWQAVLQLLEDSPLGALHVRADNHSSTPPDPMALAVAMTTNTSLQSLFLHGMAMKWLCAATFPVDIPALLLRNQWLAKVRQWRPMVGGVEPATFGQAVICLVNHGPVALSALFVLLENHSDWIATGMG
mmetsp:Transcript_3464/g.6611  ORF Transcript_3464/g.6611 Transcript_3464/m.6611 type:complete len:354 (+) Transcript_3464:95-1156(+)